MNKLKMHIDIIEVSYIVIATAFMLFYIVL